MPLDTAAPPAGTDALAAAVHEKLAAAEGPLKFADVKRGLPNPPPGGKRIAPAAKFDAAVQAALDDAVQTGRAFKCESGPGGSARYWSRDEKQHLRDAAVGAAAEPQTIGQLKTTLKALTRADAGFAEAVVRDLIGDDTLFEHPAKTKAAGPRYGTAPVPPPPPPVPPLHQAKFKTQVNKLVAAFQKLMTDTQASPGDVIELLRTRVPGEEVAVPDKPAVTPSPPSSPIAAPQSESADLDELILKAVRNAGPGSVLSLADLRREMPAEFRGKAFDAAVLRLAEDAKVRVYQDSDPIALTDRERAEYVADGHGHVFKTVEKRR